MKLGKLIIFVLALAISLNTVQSVYADEEENNTTNSKEQIAFIYINGSNNNTPKMKQWFYAGIKKFHPILRKRILNSEFMQRYFLENSTYTVAQYPQIFFWGDKSSIEIKTLQKDLQYTKSQSPKLAQLIRSVFTACMHDAIWVQKDHNMHDVVEELHQQILFNYQKGRPVVLFGYSAGSFITYEYMFNKLPDIDPVDLFTRIEIHPELIDFIKQQEVNNTCIDALINSKLAVFSNLGHLVPRQDMANFKRNYLMLDKYTNQYCMPDGALKGIVNYASPLPLFYSDITNPNYIVTYYVRLMYKYIVENDMFWLTVNYADDPLGYPTTRNFSPTEYEKALNIKLKEDRYGFIFDKSDVKSPKTCLGAHTSYWATSNKFSRAVVDAYEEGYIYFNLVDKALEKGTKTAEL